MLKNFFIPQESNNYFPIGLRPRFLLTYVVFLILFNIFALKIVHNFPVPTIFNTNLNRNILVEGINYQRTKNNLTPLTSDSSLNDLATKRANDMAEFNYFSHINPFNRTSISSINLNNQSYTYIKEELSKDITDNNALIQAFLNDKNNRKDILSSNVNSIGFGIATINNISSKSIIAVTIIANNNSISNTFNSNSGKMWPDTILNYIKSAYNIKLSFVNIISFALCTLLIMLLVVDFIYYKKFNYNRQTSSINHLPVIILLAFTCIISTGITI